MEFVHQACSYLCADIIIMPHPLKDLAAAAAATSSNSVPSDLLPPIIARWSSSFRFHAETPLAHWMVPYGTVILYLLTLLGIKVWIKARGKPFDLRKLVACYNIVLSVVSAILFTCLTRVLLHEYSHRGFNDLFCDVHQRNPRVGPLVACYYVNYTLKYVELIDTIFLVLREKKTPFIHVYHHAATLLLCWTQLQVETCMQWVIIVMNLFVHILLYAYYALHELHYDIWWKRYLTSLQIIQFLIALVASVGALLTRIIWVVAPTHSGWGAPCHGSWFEAAFGLAIIASYLYLFMQLYKDRYKKKEDAVASKDEMTRRRTTLFKSQITPKSATAMTSTAAKSSDVHSTFSPACRPTGVCPSILASAATSATSSVMRVAPEDAYVELRTAWLNHPLLVDERKRWNEVERAKERIKEQVEKMERAEDDDDEHDARQPESILHQRRTFSSHAERL